MSETKLIVTICNEKPIELIDFTESFIGLGQQYKRHSYGNYSSSSKLYIKEVRQGSTIIELIEITKTSVLPLFSDINVIVEFSKFLQNGYDFLLGKSEAKTQSKYTITDLENLSKILNSTANNSTGTTINFNVEVDNKGVINFGMSNLEANAVQNQASKEIKRLKETMPANHEKVVFTWYAAKNDLKSQSWERGVIESIYYYPIKVIFDTEDLKKAMIHPPNYNIFDVAFIVDVHVETIDGGKPILYRITNFHDYIIRNRNEENQTEIS